jgi:hypothetical protein
MSTSSRSEGRLQSELSIEFDLAAFRWDPVDDHWWWSAGMFRLYGYEPDSVEPTFSLMLQHEHPDDRTRAEQAFERLHRDGRPFVYEHRILPCFEAPRTVISSVQSALIAGRQSLVTGTALDVSAARRIHHAAAEETVAGLQAEIRRMQFSAESRDLVNRATGVLIERHKLTPEAATALLRSAAQRLCRKVPEIASELLFTGQLPAA